MAASANSTPPLTGTYTTTSVPYQPQSAKRFKLPHLTAKLLLVLIAGIVITGLAGTSVYKNAYAQSQLNRAISLNQKGDYKEAAWALRKTKSWLVLPSVNAKAANESQKNQKWLKYLSYQLTSEQLIKDKQYANALVLLQRITKDYPTYAAISIDIQTVTQQQNLIAQQMAEASKKAALKAPSTSRPSKAKPPVPQASPAPPVGCFPPSSINGKRFVDISAFSSVQSATSVSQVQQILQTFFNQYGVTVEITSVSPSSYASSYDTYSLVTEADLCQVKAFGAITVDEWSKYPADWVANSHIKDVVLVKHLAVSGQNRAATPDVVGHDMYYDVSYSGDYAREVMHHEYDHLLTYNYFGSYAPSDPTWQSYNPPGFTYGNGGASCYNPGNNCLAGEHAAPSFVTGYATSAIEEDKAELYAYLMTGTYYHHLQTWLPSDSRLNSKVNNYKQFIATHSSTMSGSYFDQINP